MRIYAIADIHAKPGHMAAIFSAVDTHQPDLIIAAGDLTHFFRWQTCLAQLDSLPVPVLAVLGNTDLKRVGPRIDKAANISLLTARPMTREGISMIGISGALTLPFSSRICLKEKERLARLPEMNENTILVAHPPPKGVLDRVGKKISSGSTNLRKFVEDRGPGLLVCGHIHEDPGSKRLGSTLVVNCAMGKKSCGAIIDIQKNAAPKVKLLPA